MSVRQDHLGDRTDHDETIETIEQRDEVTLYDNEQKFFFFFSSTENYFLKRSKGRGKLTWNPKLYIFSIISMVNNAMKNILVISGIEPKKKEK